MTETMNLEATPQKGLSSFALKWIAIITMLIDHTTAVIWERHLMRLTNPIEQGTAGLIDLFFRGIGRIAFPLFIFLLVQGFMHTRSRSKYVFRLALFAIISDIPFDFAICGQSFFDIKTMSLIDNSSCWYYQNVFFTLTLGFLFMWFADFIYKKEIAPILGYVGIGLSVVLCGYWFGSYISNYISSLIMGFNGAFEQYGVGSSVSNPFLESHGPFIAVASVVALITLIVLLVSHRKKSFLDLSRFSLTFAGLLVLMILADFLHTDYASGGVLAIAVAYAFRNNYKKSITFCVLALTIFSSFLEAIAFIDIIFVSKYNGQKGKSGMKYFFYIFYPAHLLILHLIAKFVFNLG
ncbi:MAG: conjugal transfer protein TraX [Lachnospiraceae bacterium]|nr:conjugal transfer protein TraX [Lachnospiraceae bacterium]